ncbi:MAG: ABC transporter ATP-binding protein, partial [Alphaproteobacteria bacterium]|nr:ABC transporter ATP-binding protein [Alphaproteobacteria bacterium]
KSYGEFLALDNVSLSIAPGEFVTLLGPSGSGKTTLLMALAGFARLDHGSVRFNSEEIVGLPPHRRDIGVVFQNYALFPHMNVAENVGYPLRMRRVPKFEIAQRVEQALSLVDLPGFGNRRVDQMSGGQQQRIALARAVVFEPRILLMDEPLSALDKKLRDSMQIEIRQLHDKLKTTTIYVTHDQREALTLSDRIAVMDRGHIIQIGTPRDVYDRPRTRFVADFIGETSFLPVGVADGVASFRGQTLRLAERPADGAGLLAIRPEKLILLDGDDASLNVFYATTTAVIFQGESVLIQATLGGHSLAVRQTTQRARQALLPGIGQDIRLGLPAQDAVVVADDRDAP